MQAITNLFDKALYRKEMINVTVQDPKNLIFSKNLRATGNDMKI